MNLTNAARSLPVTQDEEQESSQLSQLVCMFQDPANVAATAETESILNDKSVEVLAADSSAEGTNDNETEKPKSICLQAASENVSHGKRSQER